MFFEVYFYIAWVAIVFQLLALFQTHRNYRYAMQKYYKQRVWYEMRVCLIVPCKGIDAAFDANITSLFRQDHENFKLWFVVSDARDPAYERLCRLRDELAGDSKAQEVKILTAGTATGCSQKIHNLLHCYRNLTDDVEIMAFADSDACVRRDWLSHLVWPLRKYRYGAATGYRWFVPQRSNMASLVASSLNGRVAQWLGNMRFNQAWGGSMAIHVKTFRQAGLDEIWPVTLSDDLSLSQAVKKAGMKLGFVPACFVASYDSFTWSGLFEFARRQFLITRVYAPWTWLLSLFFSFVTVAGLWLSLIPAVYSVAAGLDWVLLYVAVPVSFWVVQVLQAMIRQKMIATVLEAEREKLKPSKMVDIIAAPFLSVLLLILTLVSAFGRTIHWRGIRYELKSPTHIVVKGVDSPE